MIKKILVILILLLLIVISLPFIVTFIASINYKGLTNRYTKVNPNTNTKATTFSTPVETLLPKENDNINDATNSNMVEITGSLCYPGSYIPSGIIEFKGLNTNKVFTTTYKGSGVENSSEYKIQVPVNGYYVARFKTDKGLSGYYTDCSIDLNNCTTKESHELTAFIAKGSLDKINLCDFYYGENEPKF